MGLSIEDLELQTAEYLPAREVMTGFGGGHSKHLLGGLVNIDVHDIDIVKDVDILTGKDGDVVDLDNIVVGGFGSF